MTWNKSLSLKYRPAGRSDYHRNQRQQNSPQLELNFARICQKCACILRPYEELFTLHGCVCIRHYVRSCDESSPKGGRK